MNVLEAKDIYKSFGDLAVLKGVSLHVEKSEIVAIVGKSGAGKTTLLQILGTLLGPDKGEIVIHDQIVNKMKSSKLSKFRNQEIGFVFQFHHLLPEFTALENVCIPGYIANRDEKKVEKEAQELLDILSIGERSHHKPSQMSGGEKQRVAIARALINHPSVILADEPSGNLDSASQKELFDLIFDLRERFQQTFIIVTHDENFASQADRIIRIKDGTIVHE